MKIYLCEVCGNILYVINDSGVNPVCCTRNMKALVPNVKDASLEKHIPFCEVKDDLLKISIGEELHPMTKEHHISWVILETDKCKRLIELELEKDPKLEVSLKDGERPKAVYAYCNLHGLWQKGW